MSENKTPRWFLVNAGVLSVWNLMGIIAFIDTVSMSEEALATLPEAQQALISSTPVWATGAFALAVFAGMLGCVLLVFKKAIAYPVLIASMVGILIQMFHSFFIANSFEVYGPGGTIMPIMVVTIGFYQIWQTKSAKDKGWIK